MRSTDQAFEAFLINNSVHYKTSKYLHSRRLKLSFSLERSKWSDFTFLEDIHICVLETEGERRVTQTRFRNMI